MPDTRVLMFIERGVGCAIAMATVVEIERALAPVTATLNAALTTGATDATAFERLGSAFASVVTGNLVLLGVSAARPDGRLALFAACALAGYAIGAFAAAPGRRPPGERRPVWPRATTLALIG